MTTLARVRSRTHGAQDSTGPEAGVNCRRAGNRNATTRIVSVHTDRSRAGARAQARISCATPSQEGRP
jgi:hypothetical protein